MTLEQYNAAADLVAQIQSIRAARAQLAAPGFSGLVVETNFQGSNGASPGVSTPVLDGTPAATAYAAFLADLDTQVTASLAALGIAA